MKHLLALFIIGTLSVLTQDTKSEILIGRKITKKEIVIKEQSINIDSLSKTVKSTIDSIVKKERQIHNYIQSEKKTDSLIIAIQKRTIDSLKIRYYQK